MNKKKGIDCMTAGIHSVQNTAINHAAINMVLHDVDSHNTNDDRLITTPYVQQTIKSN